MKNFAVIGYPIEHSLSPLIHHHFALQTGIDLTYNKILASNETFESLVDDFFEKGGLGLNVTLPYKERAYRMAQVHTLRCEKSRAANTLWVQHGKLCADTTDGIGLTTDLSRHLELKNKRVLILGAGGAARSILGALIDAKISSLTVANRTLSRARQLQDDFPQINCSGWEDINPSVDLIIHATSLGVNEDVFSLPSFLLEQKPYCYDLVYNRRGPTPFIHWAKQHGCEAIDGLGMLVEQAAEAFLIWHGVKPETTDLLKTLKNSDG